MSLVVKHSQGADTLVKLYEAKLCEEDGVNADSKAIEAVMSTLKVVCVRVRLFKRMLFQGNALHARF